jgi:putative zinc finger protein
MTEHGNHETAGAHPEELLAGFVDGSAGPDDAAAVVAHLATCPSCTDEVRVARSARDALRTLLEVASPWAGSDDGPVSATQLAETRRASVISLASRRDRRQKVARAAGALIAAAAVVAGLVFVLPSLGGSKATPTSASSGEGSRAPAATAPDQSAASLDQLARGIAHDASVPSPASGTGFDSVDPSIGDHALLSAAELSCAIDATGVGPEDTILSFERATYQGTPAYIVGYRTPATSERPGHVVVAAVARSSCSILYLVRTNLEP